MSIDRCDFEWPIAITAGGLKEALRLAETSAPAVWCGADAISDADYALLKGKSLSRFSYELGARDPEVLEEALDTIDQHHPNEVVWVEGTPTRA
ncbi:hypothetical protein QTH89_21210 [Variovorax sp. J22G21]|uniref:hypothetical protein n=1 Tax=Variovorax fucosicus TaxID=3053517 RepID=UPI002577E600|nr:MULTISPECIES: hypothetical protein [unclassified Variovorax]MDM0038966.1 hypothetical protein [Variovorax sp. J22R193]MDM0063742.1 hypothetical protein [Variovorax sp. J22G21]